MKKIIIAATAMTLGLGAYALPAFAQADDYGQFRYTQNDPTRFAPAGLPIGSRDDAGARDTISREHNRQDVFDRIDREHRQY